jgi:serine/threonine protein kinase
VLPAVFTGTKFYLAPEAEVRQGYEGGVDMWACGVVVYIVL